MYKTTLTMLALSYLTASADDLPVPPSAWTTRARGASEAKRVADAGAEEIAIHVTAPEPPPVRETVQVGFEKIDWDRLEMGAPPLPNCWRGLIGAQSELSCRKGAPAGFIAAAKAAGYHFLAFPALAAADLAQHATAGTIGREQRALPRCSTVRTSPSS